MIKLLGNIPKNFGLACSGGVDSMVVLDFLLKGNHRPKILYFNHNTDHGNEAEEFVKKVCQEKDLELFIGRTDIKPTKNKEKAWRDVRYQFLNSFDFPVITCHHLDDVIETYVFYMCRGYESLIPYSNKNIIRPFLLNEKKTFEVWANTKKVEFIQDESNFNTDFTRNQIRHNVIPELLKVHSGLKTVIKKKIKENF